MTQLQEEEVKRLLEDPSTTAEHVMDALLSSIRSKRPNIVRILIDDDRATDLDAALRKTIEFASEEIVGILLKKRVPKNAVFQAVFKDKVDILRLLLEETDVDKKECDRALYAAAAGGHLECLRVLMQVPGIDVNACNYDQSDTVLISAIRNRRIDIVEALIEDDRVDVTSKCGRFCSPLCAAAEEGNLEMVKTMLQNPRVKAREYDVDQVTPLHYAAINDRTDVVLFLLEHGFSGGEYTSFFSTCDEELVPPLLLAAGRGNARVVKVLLDAGFKVCTDYYDKTALHIAAEKGFAHVVKVILEDGGIGVNDKCEFGKTPLHYAAENNRSHVVELLLRDENIDLDAIITSPGGHPLEGYTPIHCAAYYNSLDALRVFLGDDRIDIGDLPSLDALDDDEVRSITPLHAAVIKDEVDALKMMLANKNYVNCADSYNETLLYTAASNGSIRCVEYLLQCDAIDVDLRTLGDEKYLYSALHIACEEGFTEIVEALLQADGINVNVTLEDPYDLLSVENEMQTPLHLACEYGRTRVVRALLKSDSLDVNAVDSLGFSPLCAACAKGHTNIVQLLLAEDDVVIWQHDDDEDDDHEHHHPLCVAAMNGQTEVVRVLMRDGRITISDVAENPLCLAAGNGHFRTVKLLLESWSEMYGVNADGDTALHVAASAGNVQIAQWLLSEGADGTILNNNGKTYLDCITSRSVYFALASESITTLILCLRSCSFPLELQQKIVRLAFSFSV